MHYDCFLHVYCGDSEQFPVSSTKYSLSHPNLSRAKLTSFFLHTLFVGTFSLDNSLSHEGSSGNHTPEVEHSLQASPRKVYPSSHMYLTLMPSLVPYTALVACSGVPGSPHWMEPVKGEGGRRGRGWWEGERERGRRRGGEEGKGGGVGEGGSNYCK